MEINRGMKILHLFENKYWYNTKTKQSVYWRDPLKYHSEYLETDPTKFGIDPNIFKSDSIFHDEAMDMALDIAYDNNWVRVDMGADSNADASYIVGANQSECRTALKWLDRNGDLKGMDDDLEGIRFPISIQWLDPSLGGRMLNDMTEVEEFIKGRIR